MRRVKTLRVHQNHQENQDMNYNQEQPEGGVPIKMWTRGVPVEDEAKKQLANAARLPIVFKHVAVMPDVHLGIGATVGSVIPTFKAIIPAAVGVDIGCGMMACKTTLRAEDLPDNLGPLRAAIEKAVPHGMTPFKQRGRDKGSWENPPNLVAQAWSTLGDEFDAICEQYPRLKNTNNHKHLGTLGTGNHFIEVCLDEGGAVWFMLHSGSRGVGNAIGTTFIELAKKDAERNNCHLPDENLATTEHQVISKPFEAHVEAVNCRHNYVQKETHFGEEVFVTRKGAVSAKKGELGIIPGSMGARSYIVRGLGNPESFESCSHGAGRVMSRTKAKKMFTVADQIKATEGVECRKDEAVIDEIPMAYKDIDAVMEAQKDLVEVVYTLKQVLCVKG
jgi:tRNA-splicing ligase RtcB